MNYNNQTSYSTSSSFMSKVYSLLCAGLTVTAAVSYFLPAMHLGLVGMLLLMAAQMGIIFYLQANLMTINPTIATALYTLFAGCMGISLAPIKYIYPQAAIFEVALITGLMFIVMALYGWLTKADLSQMSNILLMGLVGLMIAGLINIFLQSSMFDLMISACGVGIFSLLIAYDIQNLKTLAHRALMTPEASYKIAIFGALQLYLNVINLFLYLLRLFGDRRRD